MIKFYNQVPLVYPKISRDFQYLSWLINIVLNSVKHNIDDIYDLPNVNVDPKISELLASTLGFKVRRNYNQNQLIALVSTLPSILKYKGTIKAVEMAAEALITASGALGSLDCEVIDSQLNIIIPKDITIDVTLFIDLLDYILPAGMTYRINREDRSEHALDPVYTRFRDKVDYTIQKDLDWEITNLSTGLSGIFDVDEGTYDFSSNYLHTDEGLVLNAGLLSNTVIPVTPGKEVINKDTAVALKSTETDGSHKLLYSGPLGQGLLLRAIKNKQSY